MVLGGTAVAMACYGRMWDGILKVPLVTRLDCSFGNENIEDFYINCDCIHYLIYTLAFLEGHVHIQSWVKSFG